MSPSSVLSVCSVVIFFVAHMSNYRTTCLSLVYLGGMVLTSTACAQTTADTAAARDLYRLKQIELLESAAQKKENPSLAAMYRAQLVMATWEQLPAQRAARANAAAQYVRDMNAYLPATGDQPDGMWALDHMKFMIGPLTESAVNRIEYWGQNEHDRRELEPAAQVLAKITQIAQRQISAAAEAAEKKLAQDLKAEKTYATLYAAQQECDYYRAWADYVMALSLREDAPERKAKLAEAIQVVSKWADAAEDEQPAAVRYPALLLRGKARLLAGDLAHASEDFAAASAEKSPLWAQYQARYQAVIPALLANQWDVARKNADQFKNWVESSPDVASAQTRVSADLLMYRVMRAAALANAGNSVAGDARERALLDAEKLLRQILLKHPQLKDMIFELLATAADGQRNLTVLENLGCAWAVLIRPSAESQKEAQQRAWQNALAQAQVAARSTYQYQLMLERKEAALLVAVACGKLEQWRQAAQANLDFAAQYPDDSRAKDAAELALAQLSELRQSSQSAAEIQQLILRALNMAVDQFGQKQHQFARGAALESVGDRDKAAAVYQVVERTDEHYLDARYRLLRIAVDRLADLQSSRAPVDEQKKTARALLNQCDDYLAQVAKLPATAPQRQFVPDILLMAAGVNLHPLEQPDAALRRIADLEKKSSQASPAVMGAMLKYKVEAYQFLGDGPKAAAAVKEYAVQFPKDGPEYIRRMVAQQTREMTGLEKNDPQKAGRLAAGVASLLEPLIESSQGNDAYAYRQLRADMLARSGEGSAAQKLWVQLQQEKPGDLLNFIGEARAMFASRQYDLARDLFSRILPKVPVGSESYWECYLRIIQADDVRGKKVDVQRLKDLKVIYGDAAGGKEYHDDFAALFKKYGAE